MIVPVVETVAVVAVVAVVTVVAVVAVVTGGGVTELVEPMGPYLMLPNVTVPEVEESLVQGPLEL